MGVYKRGRPSRQNPPDKPGMYYFRSKDTGVVDYIGETSNLKRRRAQHLIAGGASVVVSWYFEWKKADGRSTSKTRRQHERSKIDQHKPRLNRRRGGGGRRAGQ